MFRADSIRSSQSLSPGANTGELAWKYVLPGSPSAPLIASASGNIYTGVLYDSNWWSGEMFTRSLTANGQLEWRLKVTPYDWGFSQDLGGVPALDPSGNLIMPSSNSELLKLSSAGAEQWKLEGVNTTVNNHGVTVLPNGNIYWNHNSSLRVISPTGQVIRTQQGGGASYNVLPSGEVYIEASRTVEAHTSFARGFYNADGSVRWSQTGLRGGSGRVLAMGPDGKIYFGPWALSPVDGSKVWEDPSPIEVTGTAVGKNGQSYTFARQIRAYNKDTGAVLWTTTLPEYLVSNVAIDSRDILYGTTATGKVIAVSPSGQILWQQTVCDKFLSGPIIGPNSTVIAYGQIGAKRYILAVR
jgi:hypothetical protein